MKKSWFRPWGWIYCPVSVPGAALCILTILFCFQVFVAIDRHSHSASDTLYGVFPYFICSLSILGWIASKTSRSS